MPLGQPQIDLWTLVLQIAKWAARIPLAALAIFSAGCVAYLGFYLVLRVTQWAWFNWLQKPWY
jgi:hypothetical protein